MTILEAIENTTRNQKGVGITSRSNAVSEVICDPAKLEKLLLEKRRLIREQLRLLIKRSCPNSSDLDLRRYIPGRKLMIDGFRVGEIVDDQYKVMKMLGSGSMGNIYLVRDLENGNVFAMKTLVEKIHSEKLVRRFIREGKELSRLNHENIINVVDFGINNGRPYYVMDNLSSVFSSEPDNMDKMIKMFHEQKVSLNTMIKYFAQIAEGLYYLHTRERIIVHRDLKPSNVLVNDSGVKLVDFGVSSVSSGTLTPLTENEYLGTPQYLPVLDFEKYGVGPKSDLYSLGVMLYLLVTKELPFDLDKKSNIGKETPAIQLNESTIDYEKGSDACLVDTPIPNITPGSGPNKKSASLGELFHIIRTEEPKYENILPGVDDRLITLIKRLLSKNPDDRPKNAQAVADELYAIEGSVRTPSFRQLVAQGLEN